MKTVKVEQNSCVLSMNEMMLRSFNPLAEHQRIIQLKNNLMNQFAGENDAVQDAEDRYESLLKWKQVSDAA